MASSGKDPSDSDQEHTVERERSRKESERCDSYKVDYVPGKHCSVLHSWTTFRRMVTLHIFRLPIFWSVVSGAVAGMLEYDNVEYGGEDGQCKGMSLCKFSQFLVNTNFQGEAYAMSMAALTFLIVFRTDHAYMRHWEGLCCIHKMIGSWSDAVSGILAFSYGGDEEDTRAFKETLVRLVSVCNAFINAELEGMETDMSSKNWRYPLIDSKGLDKTTLSLIANSSHKVEVSFQLIQNLVVKAMDCGIVTASDSVVAQSFADLSDVMSQYHQALKLHKPFPFAYSCVTEVLLVFQLVLTPIVMINWVSSSFMASTMTFLAVFTMLALNSIALELDNPFRSDAMDFDGRTLHGELNKKLLSMLNVPTNHTPSLSSHSKKLMILSMSHTGSRSEDDPSDALKGAATTLSRVSELNKLLSDHFGDVENSALARDADSEMFVPQASCAAADFNRFGELNAPAARQTSDSSGGMGKTFTGVEAFPNSVSRFNKNSHLRQSRACVNDLRQSRLSVNNQSTRRHSVTSQASIGEEPAPFQVYSAKSRSGLSVKEAPPPNDVPCGLKTEAQV